MQREKEEHIHIHTLRLTSSPLRYDSPGLGPVPIKYASSAIFACTAFCPSTSLYSATVFTPSLLAVLILLNILFFLPKNENVECE